MISLADRIKIFEAATGRSAIWNMEVLADLGIRVGLNAHCGCNSPTCPICSSTSTAYNTTMTTDSTMDFGYGDTNVWTPNGSIVCKHDWKPARVKGKKQWCAKCGEYE